MLKWRILSFLCYYWISTRSQAASSWCLEGLALSSSSSDRQRDTNENHPGLTQIKQVQKLDLSNSAAYSHLIASSPTTANTILSLKSMLWVLIVDQRHWHPYGPSPAVPGHWNVASTTANQFFFTSQRWHILSFIGISWSVFAHVVPHLRHRWCSNDLFHEVSRNLCQCTVLLCVFKMSHLSDIHLENPVADKLIFSITAALTCKESHGILWSCSVYGSAFLNRISHLIPPNSPTFLSGSSVGLAPVAGIESGRHSKERNHTHFKHCVHTCIVKSYK